MSSTFQIPEIQNWTTLLKHPRPLQFWHFLPCSYVVPFLQEQPMHIHPAIQTVQETGKRVLPPSHMY